ncbi:hypothetical protein HPB47_021055 [Ixodes persulcatus]|uniref:Uncharacterized protein n=1 Tax=Ixodes persulcatus TaxID=34615 RepID=A0AC60QDP0_IXOPE|nr:hypothetical protein HPB47_021055 [Ixodes persulcatus]
MSANSPPSKQRTLRKCVFQKDWRYQPEYESWLLPVDDDAIAARCTLCASTFTVKFDGVSAAKHHASTQKHKQKSLVSKQSAALTKFFTPATSSAKDKLTAAELGTIFRGIKHNYILPDSDVACRMQLGRTKMEHLVKDALAPYAVKCIVEKLRPAGRNLPFALSTDASNKGNRKPFPVAVRFYDVNDAGITDALINFCEQADETSGGICEVLATSVEKIDFPLERVACDSWGGRDSERYRRFFCLEWEGRRNGHGVHFPHFFVVYADGHGQSTRATGGVSVSQVAGILKFLLKSAGASLSSPLMEIGLHVFGYWGNRNFGAINSCEGNRFTVAQGLNRIAQTSFNLPACRC